MISSRETFNRFSSQMIRVKTTVEIPAKSFAVITGYSVPDLAFTVAKADSDNTGDAAVIVPVGIPANKIGMAYQHGISLVQKTSGETVAAGDRVGVGANSWTAKKSESGAWVVVVVSGDVLFVRPISCDIGPFLAKTQEKAPSANKISVKLLDSSGNVTGSAFDAYGFFVDDAATFDEVTPTIASGKTVPVFLGNDGRWWLDLTLTYVGDECEEA